jgi:hypothetical protein
MVEDWQTMEEQKHNNFGSMSTQLQQRQSKT